MGATGLTRKQFIDALTSIAEGHDGAEELTRKLRLAVLDFGSETPDNVSCTERIEVGAVGTEIGLKLTNRNMLFGDVAYALEAIPLPDELKRAQPDICTEDWDVFARLTTLIYCLLSHDVAPDH